MIDLNKEKPFFLLLALEVKSNYCVCICLVPFRYIILSIEIHKESLQTRKSSFTPHEIGRNYKIKLQYQLDFRFQLCQISPREHSGVPWIPMPWTRIECRGRSVKSWRQTVLAWPRKHTGLEIALSSLGLT